MERRTMNPGCRAGSAAAFCLGAALLCSVPKMVGNPIPAPQETGRQPWSDRTLQPERRAELLLAAMTLEEKIAQVHGIRGGGYVGNVPANIRLGIPALNLSDGPAGVGNKKTMVTAFPAPITVAAGWDVALLEKWGAALGEEQLGKGTNVHLAPMMNLIRVPQAGRTWEGYGEDPYHSSLMAAAEIRGIQSRGVIATAKHYIGNEQETERRSASTDLDERTLHEIYLAPFRASVQAQVGAVMCSYNRLNGVYACENGPAQNSILKGELGFRGWIMSDWGATHSTVASALNGLDQEMPDGRYFSDALKAAIESGEVPESRLDDMVRRMFVAMFRLGLFDRTASGSADADVRSAEHSELARDAAAQGIVLLKNSRHLLPLNTAALRSICVIGAAGDSDPIVGGGGSAAVIASNVVTPLQGIRQRAGNGVTVQYVGGDDLAAAIDMARQSEVAIVVAGVRASEGRDRPDLSLPNDQDALIAAIAEANPRTIVAAYIPAQILMPWSNQVPAILVGWLPGQEGGNALASVLFGDVNPAGRLPVTFARKVEDYPASTPLQYPGVDGHVAYSEALAVGYRHFDVRGLEPLYPFGHGLSYTTFGYSNLRIPADGAAGGPVRVLAEIKNLGSRTGAEVVQLYLGFPQDAGEPPKVLKGFQKIFLEAGKSQQVTFTLTPDDYSVWDTQSHSWKVRPGQYKVMVGASSRDIRLEGSFSLK